MGRKRVLWHVVKMRKHEMRAGVFFKRVSNKGPSVESRERVTQVTFTAVKQSTNGLGVHWAVRWQPELNKGGSGSEEYIGT